MPVILEPKYKRLSWRHPVGGVIITGQPGTGKTLYQYYLLARLLQLKQVVLFSVDADAQFLFYHNKVYVATCNSVAEFNLPQPNSRQIFLWSLIDMKPIVEPRPHMINRPCFPVQTTSPNPLRYQVFLKDNKLYSLHYPYGRAKSLREEYEDLYVALRNFFSWDQGQGDPLHHFDSVRALLKEREEREAEDALLKKRDNEEEGKEEHKQKMMETGAIKEEKVEEALDCLLDVAIERFGYAACIVFRAVFDFDLTAQRSQNAFNISSQQLKETVASLAHNGVVNFKLSDRIVAISPLYSALNPFRRVGWKVAFNSDWVAKEIMKKLNAAENIEVRQVIHFFRGIPQAGSMVRSLFEPLAHTLIPGTTGGSWPLIRMVSNKTTLAEEPLTSKEPPPKFVVPLEASPDNEVKLDQGTREIVNFKYFSKLSALDDKKYYIPDATNFALLDSFMVDIDYPRRSATLWIFQVTKSQLHRGSAMDYLQVRTLISILKNQLKAKQPPSKTAKVTSGQAPSKPVVNVRYVLLVPKGEPENWEWQFPAGWDDDACKINIDQ